MNCGIIFQSILVMFLVDLPLALVIYSSHQQRQLLVLRLSAAMQLHSPTHLVHQSKQLSFQCASLSISQWQMSRPLKIPKNAADAHSSVSSGESVSEVLNLTAAGALLECQSALVEGPAAARAALAKHGASIPSELARALETVGSYTTIEVTFTVNPFPLGP